ncbi:MAG: hypothetical protein CMF50_03520 [Legionellales bacterium]|nr:hypothetical protein [Legionellales bacterium]|tara:strand:+ start:815 stop:1543 length:729 start_codon:yes stop_codon:yes gene_type:complete
MKMPDYRNIINRIEIEKIANSLIKRLCEIIRAALELEKKKKLLVIAVIVAIAMVGSAALMMNSHGKTATATQNDTKSYSIATLSGDLADINVQLAKINQRVDSNKQLSSDVKSDLDTAIKSLQRSLGSLAQQTSVNGIADEVQKSTSMIGDKMDRIQGELQTIKMQVNHGNYIDPSNLPFTVLSIDVWNGVPYVSIAIDEHTKLLGETDSELGWVVKSLAFDKQEVVFENDQQQLIKFVMGA